MFAFSRAACHFRNMLDKQKQENAPAKRGPGRPAFVPTEAQRKQVEALAGYGMPQDQIASIVTDDGIALETLRAHFDRELRQGKAKANAHIGKTLFEKASNGDTASLIWWSKAQMRWREETNVQAVAPVTINLAWLPERGVDGRNVVEVIDVTAQPVGSVEQLPGAHRVTGPKVEE